MTAPASVVNSLRTQNGVLAIGDHLDSPTVITMKVTMPDLWETIAVRCEGDTPVSTLKRAALEAFNQPTHYPEDYVLKLRGFEVLDENASLADAGVRDGSTLLVTSRRRRPVQ